MCISVAAYMILGLSSHRISFKYRLHHCVTLSDTVYIAPFLLAHRGETFAVVFFFIEV